MSKFFDTMTAYGYALREKEEKDNSVVRYIFQKDVGTNNFVIIFNVCEKYINGCIIPTRTITHKNCVLQLYMDWKQLEEEIKCLAEMSKYNIIMSVEEDQKNER